MAGMAEPPKDLDTVNDNRPVEHELAIVLAWAQQAGYVNVAAAVQRALTDLTNNRAVLSRIADAKLHNTVGELADLAREALKPA